MGEGDGDSHPVPGILLVVWGLIPVGHEEEGLDDGDAVGLVVEIVQGLCTLVSGRYRRSG